MIGRYLHEHLGAIIFTCMTLVIFWTVSGLYLEMRIEIVYASIIVAVIGIVVLCAGYPKYASRMRCLDALDHGRKMEMESDALPLSHSPKVQMYQRLLISLQDSYRKYISKEDEKYRDRSDYFMMWAHQIKTPIAAMHLLIDSQDQPQEKDQLFWIEEYVSMVMHYLKSDDVTNDFLLAPYELDPIIEEAIRHYSGIFIRKKLKVDFHKTGMRVVTDKKWLLFVIEQVLSNALKYTKEGTITITGENMRLVIQDTGCGIREEDLPRLFEKGYTGYNGRMNEHSSGLGLYLCRRVLDQLGHTIALESKLGIGTKVTIGLDLTEA